MSEIGSGLKDTAPRVRLKGLLPLEPNVRRFVRQGDPAPEPDPSERPIAIRDARALQAGAESEAAFFDAHGFVLLDHRSAVDNWGDDFGRWTESPAAQTYLPEIDRIVRERLFAGRTVEVDQSLSPVRRGGSGPDSAIYAESVHQDFGLAAPDYLLNLAGGVSSDAAERWQERYEREDVSGFVAISFWRTIGMKEPLRHLPLALCDPRTVAMSDVFRDSGVAAIGGAASHIVLRFAPAQTWYHYPLMTGDEVLAFKLFECRKDDPEPSRLRSVFHTAFSDPAAPADAPRRHSFEHRVGVMVLRD